MLFSIVVPVYGVEKFLSKCIESILVQDYNDYELILVDDGSKDSSASICDSYQKRDSHIRVLHKKNGGLVSARKAGLAISTGQYVLPVDGDDWIVPGLLSHLQDLIKKHSGIEVICYGAYQGISETDCKNIPFPYKSGIYDKAKIERDIYPRLIKGSDGHRFPPNIWGKAFLRETYQKYQNCIPDQITLGEDAAVTYPLISHVHSLYILNEPYYYYRLNPNSMTKSRKKGFDWENLRVLADVWKKELNPDYNFETQINRYMCHDLFNVVKSHLQTNQPYVEMRQKILDELNRPDFLFYVTHAHFDLLSLEQLPRVVLKYQLLQVMRILAHYM